MPNLYGVANPVIYPFYELLIGGANLNCPAGVETNIFQTGTFTTLDRGNYYISGALQICTTIGATAPSVIVLAARMNNGADIATYQVNSTLLVANTSPTLVWFPLLFGFPTAFWPPGSNVQISLNPTGQNVTCTYYCSQALINVFRGPDV